MERIWSAQMPSHTGERVELAGWLHRLRRLGGVSFLILRDGRGLAQIVLDSAELVEQAAVAMPESVLRVCGTVTANTQAPRGVELIAQSIYVVSEATMPPPFELHRPQLGAQLATRLDHAAVSLRHPRQRALIRLASVSAEAFRATLRDEGFMEVFTPKIVGTASEGGANLFSIDYFGRSAYLAQSPQLYKQILVGVYERVFEVGPVFRAEPHDTPRHLNQYTSLDAEFGFLEDHTTVMRLVERVVRGMLQGIVTDVAGDLGLTGFVTPRIPASGIPSVDFVEAQHFIETSTGETVAGELDLAPSHERMLGEWALREYESDFLFVTGFPLAKRPFYTHPNARRPEFSNSFDLLFRGLEIVTGGQRLHRYADYLKALAERGMAVEPFAGYLEAFKHGMPPHGGFAMGLERWVARLTNLPNVREATLFPRDLQRLTP
jgi:nondiscriminating aspartyl-tRNA synthetase